MVPLSEVSRALIIDQSGGIRDHSSGSTVVFA